MDTATALPLRGIEVTVRGSVSRTRSWFLLTSRCFSFSPNGTRRSRLSASRRSGRSLTRL